MGMDIEGEYRPKFCKMTKLIVIPPASGSDSAGGADVCRFFSELYGHIFFNSAIQPIFSSDLAVYCYWEAFNCRPLSTVFKLLLGDLLLLDRQKSFKTQIFHHRGDILKPSSLQHIHIGLGGERF